VKDEERDICGSKLKNPSNLFKYKKQPLAFSHAPGHLNRLSQAALMMPHFHVMQWSAEAEEHRRRKGDSIHFIVEFVLSVTNSLHMRSSNRWSTSERIS
jgi:hypothetical protein